jgi:chaperonin GroEL (HSP60 family)
VTQIPGTTTATILTRAIFIEGCKAVAAGMNPMDLKRGIDMAVEQVVKFLKDNSKVITTSEEVENVGFQSCTTEQLSSQRLPLFLQIMIDQLVDSWLTQWKELERTE